MRLFQDSARPVVSRPWRVSVAMCCALVLVMLAAHAALAQARSSDDIQRELEAARQESTALSSQLGQLRQQISTTEEELAQIGVRLDEARGRLRAAEGQVALAEEALAEAEAEREERQDELDAALRLLAAAETELELEETRLAEQLVESFKFGTAGAQRGAMVIEVLRRAHNPNDFAVGMKQLRTVIDVQEATVTRVFALRDERAVLSAEAEQATQRAEIAANQASDTLLVVESLREDAAAVAAEISADEQRQQVVLSGLQGDAASTNTVLQRVASRERELREELAVARARELGGSDRSGFAGWAGGPDISGAVCPVKGARSGRDFINDWGYPRWPNRWHQGTDVFASRGTAVVAVADGTVIRMNTSSSRSSLGGITVTYRTSDGSEWYNAHLDAITSGISVGTSVSRGQQIGTVGNTGNARATPPHLHFGRRHNGQWVNPWPTLTGWC